MQFVFIASPNGLGHARRIINLIPSFKNFSKNQTLCLSKRQFRLLSDEIKTLDITIVFIENYGLDGLLVDEKIQVSKVSAEIISILKKADVVLSDNSFWPAKYTNKFYLLGHFEWLTHFIQNKGKQNLISEKVAREELQLVDRVNGWFQTKDFALNSEFTIPTVPVPLLRYASDKSFEKEITLETWVACGTTGKNVLHSFINPINFTNLVRKESWRMNIEPHKPILIIGRPGLGTIRDCLASSTCFSSQWTGDDTELMNNESVLNKIGLKLNLKDLINDQEIIQYLSIMQKKIQDYWASNSVPAFDIAKIILNKVG